MNKLTFSSCLLFFTLIHQITTAYIITRPKRQTTDQLTVDPHPITNEIDFGSSSNTLYLYVGVKSGASPVINAKVTATLDSGLEKISVVLLDDGKGDDNDSKDGTYTGTVHSCPKSGRYNIDYRVEIVEETCKRTSLTDCEKLPQMSPLLKSGGSVMFKNCEVVGQLEGVGVRDLKSDFDKLTSKVTISWTEGWSPATVVAYKLYYLHKSAPDVQEWVDNGKVLLDLKKADPINQERNYIIDLSGINGQIYVAIVAQSASGSKALSNVIVIYINDVTETTTETTTEITTEATTESTTHIETTTADVTTATETTIGDTSSETDQTSSAVSTVVETDASSSTDENQTTIVEKSNASAVESWVIVGIVSAVLVLVGGIVTLVLISKHKYFYKTRVEAFNLK